MTQGRFETLCNCRPSGFDERKFWAKDRKDGKEYGCEKDHRQRESCPFHDLRADGCFQPERWGAGVGSTTNIAPKDLFQRPRGGKPFATSVNRRHAMVGCGGMLLPVDTVPGKAIAFHARSYDARPWTSTQKMTKLFSRAPYMSVPPPEKIVPPVEPPFRTSKSVTATEAHFEHIPDEYGKRVTAERPAFRLKAGKVPFRLDPRLRFEPGAERQDAKQKKPRRTIPRTTYFVNNRMQGTFSAFPHYLSTPYSEPKISSERRPIFTYATKTKRTMPVGAPWHAGLSTAEPKRERPATAS